MMTGRTLCTFVGSALLLASAALADSTPASPLDPRRWGVVYDVPETRNVKVEQDVPYLTDASGTLTVDIYSPAGAKASDRRPAVVFINAIGDAPDNRVKRWAIYSSWPRLVAAHGLVGISMDADAARIDQSLHAVFDFLAAHGGEHGVDGSRVGAYAASANVTGATRVLLGKDPPRNVKAAAFYYGAPPPTPRKDLPLLLIFAESDVPNAQPALNELWKKVVEAKAPWTMVFGAGLPHAFDAFANNDDSRRLIQQTIAFWKSNLEPVPPGPPSDPDRDIVATLYWNNAQRTTEVLGPWLQSHQSDPFGWARYADALGQLRRFDEASTAWNRVLAIDPENPGAFGGLGAVRMAQQRYPEAIDLFSRAIDKGAPVFVYGQLAMAQLMAGKNEDAAHTYETGLEKGIPPGPNARGIALFNLACAYARLGKQEKALETLVESAREGFANRERIEGDNDLKPLMKNPAYEETMNRIAALPR